VLPEDLTRQEVLLGLPGCLVKAQPLDLVQQTAVFLLVSEYFLDPVDVVVGVATHFFHRSPGDYFEVGPWDRISWLDVP
jgi:hypothetical protein